MNFISRTVKPTRVGEGVVHEVLGADTIFKFPPQGPPPGSFIWKGGPILSAPSIQPIFWGAEWGAANPPLSPTAIVNAIGNIIGGPYLNALGQYGITGRPAALGPMFVLDSEPPATPTLAQISSAVSGLLNRLIDDGQLPEPDENWAQFNVVFLPSTVAFFPFGAGQLASGAHNTFQWQDYDLFDVDDDPVRYAFISTQASGSISAMDMTTSTFAHELVEAMTDPEGNTGWRQNPDPGGTGGEIGDVCGQVGRLDGTAVQAYWSNLAGACVIPTHDHSVIARETDSKEVSTTDGPELHINIDRLCGKSHRWKGSYAYHVASHTVSITLTATTTGYTDPIVFWTVAGINVPFGTSTITPTVAASYPTPFLPTETSQPVTVHVHATFSTLQISNDPADGSYGLPVTYNVDEKLDNLPGQITKASSSTFIDIEGQTIRMPADWAQAFAECVRADSAAIEIHLKDLKDRMSELIDLIKQHGTPPPIDQTIARDVTREALALVQQLRSTIVQPGTPRQIAVISAAMLRGNA